MSDNHVSCKPNKITNKYSVAIVSGFQCHVCDAQTVTYDGSHPAECLHCGEKCPKLKWQDKITTHVKAETIRL